MNDKRWPLAQAEAVAQELDKLLEPACERIAIAGSIRRRSPEVGDIELLVIPRAGEWFMDSLEQKLWELMRDQVLTKRPNKEGHINYGKLNKLMVHVASGIPVDIFSTTKQNWGMALMVRTGSREWNIKVMSRLRRQGVQGHAYAGLTVNKVEIACPDEETIFRYLGWRYVPPEKRS